MNLNVIILIGATPFYLIAMRTEYLLDNDNNAPQSIQQQKEQEIINNFIQNCKSSVTTHCSKIQEGSLGTTYQNNSNTIPSAEKFILKKQLIIIQLTEAHREINNLTDPKQQQNKAKPYITNIQKIINGIKSQ
jgi:hypothetical protein